MDFYLIEDKGNFQFQRFHFPVNPEQVTCKTAARTLTFDSMNLGKIILPKGREPTVFSFEGLFPGPVRRDSVLVKDYTDPQVIAGLLSWWRNAGTKLNFVVTDTPINHDVYIQNFVHTWGGGHGDARYQLELVEALAVTILTDQEWKAQQGIAQPQGNKQVVPLANRPAPASPPSHTVQKGDSLWKIAQQYLGAGSRYREIYDLNAEIIGPNPDVIQVGQVLLLPGSQA